jgi:hypothetical protein
MGSMITMIIYKMGKFVLQGSNHDVSMTNNYTYDKFSVNVFMTLGIMAIISLIANKA